MHFNFSIFLAGLTLEKISVCFWLFIVEISLLSFLCIFKRGSGTYGQSNSWDIARIRAAVSAQKQTLQIQHEAASVPEFPLTRKKRRSHPASSQFPGGKPHVGASKKKHPGRGRRTVAVFREAAKSLKYLFSNSLSYFLFEFERIFKSVSSGQKLYFLVHCNYSLRTKHTLILEMTLKAIFKAIFLFLFDYALYRYPLFRNSH